MFDACASGRGQSDKRNLDEVDVAQNAKAVRPPLLLPRSETYGEAVQGPCLQERMGFSAPRGLGDELAGDGKAAFVFSDVGPDADDFARVVGPEHRRADAAGLMIGERAGEGARLDDLVKAVALAENGGGLMGVEEAAVAVTILERAS